MLSMTVKAQNGSMKQSMDKIKAIYYNLLYMCGKRIMGLLQQGFALQAKNKI